ncbi:MAG: MBL fold metallo-hydrolase [Candidatus Aenigmarchaeota archaeon]|nr:MBL fold metallo-hydrolase [Candidatus Aenigmarchaeota archaeon]MCX8179531.1 MBL fold metallo-hydrolase [Candidatus Aenigmarchaeota archaeon]
MKIVFLGTGSVILTGRNQAGILMEIGKKKLLFDCGAGVAVSLAKIGYTPYEIDYLFMTHFHPDHSIDFVTLVTDRGFRKRTLKVYGPIGLKKFTKIFYTKLYPELDSFLKCFEYLELNEVKKNFELNEREFKISSSPTKHTEFSLAYRIETKNKVILYSGDTGECEEVINLGKNVDIAILECSFPSKKVAVTPNHLYPEACGRMAKRMNAKKLVLMHFFPSCEKKEREILSRVKKFFDGEVVLAKDGIEMIVE